MFFKLGAIFFPIWGNWGQMCKWNLKMFFNWGQMGAQMCKWNLKFYFDWGLFFKFGANGGKCVSGI